VAASDDLYTSEMGLLSRLLRAACSGGGPQTVPVGSQAAPLSQPGPHLVAPGFQRDTSCPSQCIAGLDVGKGKTKVEFCITVSKTANCNKSGLTGDWTWSGKITTIKGKKYSKIEASFKPNPRQPNVRQFQGEER
jgi:hypothetical protein